MEKAFDVKVLGERLKAQGLPMAEEAIEKLLAETFGWVKESCALHDNIYLKAVGPLVVDAVAPLIAAQVDKIDGQPG